MERRERWLSLAIFFSFYRINFRGSCDSSESQLPLFWTIYFPTAPSACDHFAIYNYSAEIAPVGHAASHAPQSMQESASISYLPSPSEIAPTGHSPSQEPHITHSSLITCAIVYVPSFYDFRRSTFAFALSHFNTIKMNIQGI